MPPRTFVPRLRAAFVRGLPALGLAQMLGLQAHTTVADELGGDLALFSMR